MKNGENQSRSLGIQTKKIFGEYLNDVNINEICFNGDGSIWTQDFKSIWTEHKRDISYDEMMAFVEELKVLDPDAIVVVAFGQLIPPSILDMPTYGCINVHPSLLPRYRGASPISAGDY